MYTHPYILTEYISGHTTYICLGDGALRRENWEGKKGQEPRPPHTRRQKVGLVEKDQDPWASRVRAPRNARSDKEAGMVPHAPFHLVYWSAFSSAADSYNWKLSPRVERAAHSSSHSAACHLRDADRAHAAGANATVSMPIAYAYTVFCFVLFFLSSSLFETFLKHAVTHRFLVGRNCSLVFSKNSTYRIPRNIIRS